MTSGSTRHETPSLWTEFVAGLSTFLTLSYILLLNPVLLSRAGIDISAAFFATVVSAGFTTLLMGLWARLPFAVAPAPSLTTFFVSYVCLTLGLAWQAALAAVIVSGALSILMAWLAIREKMIEATPVALKIGVLFAIGGFLVANGLSQAKLVGFSGGLIGASSTGIQIAGLAILGAGLIFTIIFSLPQMRFAGAPLVGILIATVIAALFGVRSHSEARLTTEMFSAIGQVDFTALLDWRILPALFIFFIIDFFGGLGKFIGLFAAMDHEFKPDARDPGMKRALYVDGIGNFAGGFLGASSLAVFISSVVGIKAGGRTGRTAVFTAMFIFASLLAVPLVGAIPVEATSGILIYIGFLLIPWQGILRKKLQLTWGDWITCGLAGLIALFTFSIDRALLVVFVYYAAAAILRGARRQDSLLILTSVLLAGAVAAQAFMA